MSMNFATVKRSSNEIEVNYTWRLVSSLGCENYIPPNDPKSGPIPAAQKYPI